MLELAPTVALYIRSVMLDVSEEPDKDRIAALLYSVLGVIPAMIAADNSSSLLASVVEVDF